MAETCVRESCKIGVIADTHGLMRPEALDALQTSELIIHAGDIGKMEVLTELQSIAPVIAIRGNIDRGESGKLPERQVAQVGDSLVYILHDLKELDLDPEQYGYSVVICAHSHKPSITERDGVMYLNPGAAGPRRFTLPISVAHLQFSAGKPIAEIIELDV